MTVSAGTLTVGGVISNGTTVNSLTENGNGQLTLTAENTYTGGTTVNGGTLYLNKPANDGNGTVIGSLTINAGGNVNASTDNWDLGYNSGARVTTIAINGGSLTFRGNNANGGTMASTISMTGGTIAGSQFTWQNYITDTPTLRARRTAQPQWSAAASI